MEFINELEKAGAVVAKGWEPSENFLEDRAAAIKNARLIGVAAVSLLPVLVGSEKQIAWAEKIRLEKINHVFGAFNGTINARCDRQKYLDEINRLFNEASASSWIKVKGENFLSLAAFASK